MHACIDRCCRALGLGGAAGQLDHQWPSDELSPLRCTSTPFACHPPPPLQYLNDVQLGQGGETSAEYSIHLPRQLPPREFILQLTLVYAAGGQFKTKMFFNETIQVRVLLGGGSEQAARTPGEREAGVAELHICVPGALPLAGHRTCAEAPRRLPTRSPR